MGDTVVEEDKIAFAGGTTTGLGGHSGAGEQCPCPMCQSPFNIETAKVKTMADAPSLRNASFDISWENNAPGRVLVNESEFTPPRDDSGLPPRVYDAAQVRLPNAATISVKRPGERTLKCFLGQFHLHFPSEHKIDSKGYAGELHFVFHDNNDKPRIVLGVMIKEGAENEQLEAVLERVRLLKDKARPAAQKEHDEEVKIPIDFSYLLPSSKKVFYTKGSLTTPLDAQQQESDQFQEGMKWLVMQQNIEASKEQIEEFKRLVGRNNRPIQEAGDREIGETEVIMTGLEPTQQVENSGVEDIVHRPSQRYIHPFM